MKKHFKDYIKETFLYLVLKNIYIKRIENINHIKQQRNKLFPGKIKLVDLYNGRYISRKPIYDFLLSNISMLKGTVLDFGCGSMEYKKILRNTKTYIGLDIEGAEDNGFIGKGKVTYYDGLHIPFENEKFDSVLAIEVFEHVEQLKDILKELNRVMKEDGLMLFTVPMSFPLHLEPWDFRRFTKYGIKKMLLESGFEIVEVKGSTTFKNTLRRLRIIEGASKKGWAQKIDIMYNNICFALSNNVTENEKFPIDWLVICKKIKEEE